MAGLVASLTLNGYDMILVGGSLPEVDATQPRQNLRTRSTRVWQELHVSLRLAPSANAHLCTYYRRFKPFAPAATTVRPPISQLGSCFWNMMGAMVLQWTWAGAVALLEQNGLAHVWAMPRRSGACFVQECSSADAEG